MKLFDYFVKFFPLDEFISKLDDRVFLYNDSKEELDAELKDIEVDFNKYPDTFEYFSRLFVIWAKFSESFSEELVERVDYINLYQKMQSFEFDLKELKSDVLNGQIDMHHAVFILKSHDYTLPQILERKEEIDKALNKIDSEVQGKKSICKDSACNIM